MALLDYSGAIKIAFDRPIINDPEIVLSTESYKPVGDPYSALVPISAGDNASFPKERAFNGNTGDYWRSSSTVAGQWIGLNFGTPVTLDKVRVYMGYSSGRINAYEIQYSDDGSAWTAIASGNFTNTSEWQEVTFDAASHQYWRLVGNSRFSSYYTVSEMEFYGTRNLYDVPGWTVTSQEHIFVPGGDLVAKTHTVRKVTRSEDMLSITLWLDMYSRMRAPAGLVTVSYDKTTGNLKGMGNIQVESFTLTFTPTGITPIINPIATEALTASVAQTVSGFDVIYQYRQGLENITASADISVVVTKVGDQPL